MTETKIYVGLNDPETGRQLFETEKYINILKGVCKSYKVAFSFSVAQGGYIHEDGAYTRENSLIISLVDTKKGTVDEIARDLCAFFHRETVMITTNAVRTYYVRESL